MNIKRAVLISIVAYAGTFVLAAVIGLLLTGGVATDPQEVPQSLWYLGMFIAMAVMGCASWWYFRKVSASWQRGLLFGLIAILVGFVLDTLTVLPFANPLEVLLPYYLDPFFSITVILILLTTSGVGFWASRR